VNEMKASALGWPMNERSSVVGVTAVIESSPRAAS
jgi:hypothetical protein